MSACDECTNVDRQIVGYLLSGLEGAPRGAVEAHLVRCSRCVQALVDAKRALDGALDVPEPPTSLRLRIRSRVEEIQSVARTGGGRRDKWLGLMAAGLAATLFVVAASATRAMHDRTEAPRGLVRTEEK